MRKLPRVVLVIPVLFLVAVLAVVLGFTGLRMRTDSSTNSAASSVAANQQEAPSSPSRGVLGTEAADNPPMIRAVISTGQVTVHPESISRARSEVMRLVISWGGTIADEQSSSDNHGQITDSTLIVRIPAPKFGEAMAAFAGLGNVERQSRKSEDVTTTVIDNDARVRAAERSIRQIENLLGRATKLSDVIAIESDLARRQSDLDSLKAQQAYLADQTSLSTVNVYLSRAKHVGPPAQQARGFLAGLDNGWSALGSATVLLLTVLGALLPFGLLVALLGVPLWFVVRRRLGAARLSAASVPARSA